MGVAEIGMLAFMSFRKIVDRKSTASIRPKISTARSSGTLISWASSPTKNAIARLVGAPLLEQNGEWPVRATATPVRFARHVLNEYGDGSCSLHQTERHDNQHRA
jgi:hypothetical protein